MSIETIVLLVFFASYSFAYFTKEPLFTVVAAIAAGIQAIIILLKVL
jgi:hypothetical protein